MSCYKVYDPDHKHIGFICGHLGDPCLECGDVSDYLCDFPIGKGKTCDRPLCEYCAARIGPDMHYCPAHNEQWIKFRDNGGVKKCLENVVPFKGV